jgi:oligopeptide transport system substrate-binding protein
MLRILIIPLALLVMLLGAMVWSGGGVEKRAEFAFLNRGDIYTLDLNKMSYLQDFRMTYGIREGLYSPHPETMRPIPAGATGYALSDDKRVWTFHLRPEARWSNGDPVTAHDYVFSWRRMLEEPGEYTYLYDYIKNAKSYTQSYARGEPIDFKTVGIEAVDNHTFKVTLDNPVPYLLELMAFPPFYPRHERSMTKYRVFVDTDVMDAFEQWVASNKKGFDPKRATQDELLDALAEFAATNPLKGAAAEKKDSKALGVGGSEDGAPDNKLDSLPPAEVLKRMVAGRFLRYTFNKAYTLPPDVVTNGPYNLTRWDFRRRLLLEKSDTYWDKANVKTNTIEMVVSENPQSQLLLYETGQVDWNSDVVGEQAAELKANGRTDLRTSPAFGTMFMTLMCSPTLPPGGGGGKNPLADVRVRQALAMSIDKRFIVNNITRMDELPARTYLPPDGTLPDFIWQPGPGANGAAPRQGVYQYKEVQQLLKSDDGLTGQGPGLPYDVARARQLLAEAGYPNGQGFPSLPVLYGTNSPTRRDICQVLKNQWKQALNIDVQIQGVEGKIFSQRVSAKDYAIATVAWYGDYPDVSTFTDKYVSTSLQNDSAWVNKAFDDLCDKATREPDEKKRTDMLSRAEHMIDTDVPIIPIYHYVNVSLSRDNVHGVLPNPRQITIFKNVWVEKK